MSLSLDDRIRDVLARLSLLADGATMNLNPETIAIDHRSDKADSQAPVGVELRDAEKPPDQERCSLFEWYSWHFARVEDRDRREALYLLAEMDYRKFRFYVARQVKRASGELVENDPKEPGAAERKNAERVIDWYEGVPALTVAVLEGQTEAWVKKARLQHNRDPKNGRPRPEFYGWSEKRRRVEVAALASEVGQERAAQRLGVVKSTVQRYWPKDATVAA